MYFGWSCISCRHPASSVSETSIKTPVPRATKGGDGSGVRGLRQTRRKAIHLRASQNGIVDLMARPCIGIDCVRFNVQERQYQSLQVREETSLSFRYRIVGLELRYRERKYFASQARISAHRRPDDKAAAARSGPAFQTPPRGPRPVSCIRR